MIERDANPDGLTPEELDQIKREIVPYLLEEFERRSDCLGRSNILRILGKIRDERVGEFLINYLKEPRPECSGVGLKALAEFPDHPQAKEVFVRYLHSDEVEEREPAALGLYRLGDPRGIKYLLYEIEDIHPVLKKRLGLPPSGFVALTLGKLGDPRAIDPLFRKLGEFGWFAAKALIDIAQKNERETKEYTINKAAEMLGGPSRLSGISYLLHAFLPFLWLTKRSIRVSRSFWAPYILCMLGDERGLPTMVENLGYENPSIWGAGGGNMAIHALGGLNTDKALRILARHVKEPEIENCIEASFTYRDFEDDPLLKVVGIDMERLRKERIEDDRLLLSHIITRRIDYKTLALETRKRDERFKQMAKEALQDFRLTYGEKGLDNPEVG